MITNGASSIWTSNPKNANNLRLSQKWARLDESHMTWFLTNNAKFSKIFSNIKFFRISEIMIFNVVTLFISKKDNFAFFENTKNFNSKRYWSNVSSRWSRILWLVIWYNYKTFIVQKLNQGMCSATARNIGLEFLGRFLLNL